MAARKKVGSAIPSYRALRLGSGQRARLHRGDEPLGGGGGIVLGRVVGFRPDDNTLFHIVELRGESEWLAGGGAPRRAGQDELAPQLGAAGEDVVFVVAFIERKGAEADFAAGVLAQEFERLAEDRLGVVAGAFALTAEIDDGERPAGLQGVAGGADERLSSPSRGSCRRLRAS